MDNQKEISCEPGKGKKNHSLESLSINTQFFRISLKYMCVPFSPPQCVMLMSQPNSENRE